jgi:hypothetical protein
MRSTTVDQNLALQRDALTEAGCAKIFTEQMSGAVTDRPALHDALEFARSGDTLIVWKLDRGDACQSRYRRDSNRAPPRRLSGDALSLHPRRANREYPWRLRTALYPKGRTPQAGSGCR